MPGSALGPEQMDVGRADPTSARGLPFGVRERARGLDGGRARALVPIETILSS